MLINYFFSNLDVWVRALASFLTAIGLTIIMGKPFITLVKKYVHPIRTDGPQTHLKKKNTATFGGILIILIFLVTLLIWADLNRFVLIVIGGGISFALIGLVDDILKLKHNNPKGLSGKVRLFLGFLISIAITVCLYQIYPWEIFNNIYWPYIIEYNFAVSWLYFIWVPFVITGTANSVNLTDGLDGLASLTVVTVVGVFSVLVYGIYSSTIPNGLFHTAIEFHKPLAELLVLTFTLMGAILGFLWYNANPANLFMGDVGSLFLGGILGTLAIILKYEMILIIAGIIFILEALSVILQVYYFKMTKKRIFLMAPFHHHFEKKGFNEQTVVNRFWLCTVIMSALSLVLCLIRLK